MKKLLILFLIISACEKQSKKIPNNLFRYSLLEPKIIKKISEEHYFVDFGKDAFGTLLLNITSTQNDTITIHLGEKIVKPFIIDKNPGGAIRYQKIVLPISPEKIEYTIKLLPDLQNTNSTAIAVPDSFEVIMPFRYCEIENLKTSLSTKNIKQKAYNYNFDDNASSFTSSDSVLNQVWDLCKHSIKATSFCGIYIDGDRERIPYEADALINQLSHYSVDNEYSIARRTNEYFIENPTWPTEWVLQTVPLFYNDYLYTGDIAPVEKYYDKLKTKSLIDLESEDGLISSKSVKLTDALMTKLGFKNKFKEMVKKKLGLKNKTHKVLDIVDWPEGERDGYDMVEINTVVNSFYYMNLRLMAEIAGHLRKKEDSVYFYKKSLVVKEAINEKLFDKKKGIYIDGENSVHSSLHANMFPLAFGLIPDNQVKSVVTFIKTKGMACSPYGAQYLLEGLYKANEADYAFGLITALNERSWWNMIKSGATITMEAWDMKYKPNADWNHAWGTAPANITTRFLWGITPLQPGFTKVQIKPQLSKLSYSKIKVPTIIGPIIAEYRQINKKNKRFIISIPNNMTADFILPYYKDIQVSSNKKMVKLGTLQLNAGINTIEIY